MASHGYHFTWTTDYYTKNTRETKRIEVTPERKSKSSISYESDGDVEIVETDNECGLQPIKSDNGEGEQYEFDNEE